jgi:hypothetical protein
MMEVIFAFITKVVIPELVDYLKRNPNATDEEVIAALRLNTAAGIAKGEAWLNEHR